MNRTRNAVAVVGLGFLFSCAIGNFYIETISEEKNYKVMAQSKDNLSSREHEIGVEIVLDNNNVGEGVDNRQVNEEIEITTEEAKEKTYYNKYRDVTISERDYHVLLRIVEAEATGGTQESKRMVANVVLNRVKDEKFPDTVEGVVFQRGIDGTAQFSPISDGRYNCVTITKETKKAVKMVLEGEDETQGALFFLNRNTASTASLGWFDSSLKYLFDCGGHSYYCYKN